YRYRFRSFITNKINNTTSKSVYHHLSSNANVLFPLLFLTTIFSLFIPIAKCEEECLRSKVWCYECESINDPYCSDPFNVSFDMSLMRMCEGCCVKIVVEKNTPQKNIWRTCTSRLQINLFMVDHVCMEESGGQGHMCFCESDGCNSSPSSPINYYYFHYHYNFGHPNNQRIIISIISTIIILFILNELITSILFTSSVSVSLSFLLAINWLPSSSSMSLWTTKFPLKFLHLSLFIIMMILLMIIPLIFYRS
uniref:UPAR/Ly6 domain-containing protein qvr n=1 Tax=Dermatophagoides pteronyssinus TaxID=6956 RepID=A0A6P6YBK2_DERPT